ncbi:MAG: hypothetical protein HUU15_08490 [Candidatus Brocadiae bacterium]|nr:hypothetical protein [Candidatus Brocadiia bacterium]
MSRLPASLLLLACLGCAASRESATVESAPRTDRDTGLAAPASDPVDITVDTPDAPLGCYTVVILFDPAAVQIAAIEPSPEFRAPDYSEHTFHTGEVVLSAYQLQPAPPGRILVARIRFESLHGGQSRLDVRLESLYDPDGVPLRGRAQPSRTRVP